MRILDRESEFFGEKIGFANSIDGDCWAIGEVDSVWLLLDATDQEGQFLAHEQAFYLMDIRVTLQRPTASCGSGSRLVRVEDLVVLRQIARTAYRGTTHLYADPAYKEEKVDDYYDEWIRRSVAGEADTVLVAERDDKPVGFVSIHLGEETSSIGLIGVSADHRGRGVGQELVSSAVNWAKAQKRPEITVVTQGRNVAAQRCFQRAGFLTSRTELWFHGRFT